MSSHGVVDESIGRYEWLDDVGHEVWREDTYPRWICSDCNNDCQFEQMTNLDYLEWKADEHG
jgi:hypothetical protein